MKWEIFKFIFTFNIFLYATIASSLITLHLKSFYTQPLLIISISIIWLLKRDISRWLAKSSWAARKIGIKTLLSQADCAWLWLICIRYRVQVKTILWSEVLSLEIDLVLTMHKRETLVGVVVLESTNTCQTPDLGLGLGNKLWVKNNLGKKK